MGTGILQHCFIENDHYISECSLIQCSLEKYEILVTSDPLAVFVDFESESIKFNKLKPKRAIENFVKMCLDSYTCHGDFSMEEVAQNGERIQFIPEINKNNH